MPDNFAAATFYPSKMTSRLHALRNLWLPLHNRRFALLVGLIYLLFGWIFQIAIADPTNAIRSAQQAKIEIDCRAPLGSDAVQILSCIRSKNKKLNDKLDALAGAGAAPSVSIARDPERWWSDIRSQGILRSLGTLLSVQLSGERLLSGLLASPAFLFLALGLWAGLIKYVDTSPFPRFLRWPVKFVFGTAHAAAHLAVALTISSLFSLVTVLFSSPDGSLLDKVFALTLYNVFMVVIGGAVGSIVYGFYWVFTSLIFSMHPESFGALGIKDYKNFLRMKFEKDTLTIYPIALDRVPGRHGWRARRDKEREDHKPLIVPIKELKPRLIEAPIKITRTAARPA